MKKALKFKSQFPFFTFDDKVQAGSVRLEDGVPQETRRLKTPGKKWDISVDLDSNGEVIGVEIKPKSKP